jgi:hypothetical protein
MTATAMQSSSAAQRIIPSGNARLYAMYGFSIAEIAMWQTARIVVIEHEPDGSIRSVETRPVPEIAHEAGDGSGGSGTSVA